MRRRTMSDEIEEMDEEEDLEVKDKLELRDYDDEIDWMMYWLCYNEVLVSMSPTSVITMEPK